MKNQFDKLLLLKRLRYLLCIGLFMLAANSSYADHFRYGNITWQRVPGAANTVQFKITMAFKRTFFPNSSTIIVGSTRSVGGMSFGDGSSNAIITLTVTAVNTKDDWFYGEYVTTHTYTNPGTYFAAYSAGVARLGAPLLKNNASGNIAVVSKVQVGNGSTNDAPVSVIPPFINFPIGQSVVSYQIPAIDPNNDSVTYSLTPADSFGVGCSQPAGLAISQHGLLTWSTTNPSMKVGDLYNTSIRVKDSKGAYISLDVLIKIVSPSLPSTFSSSNPPDGTIIQTQPGEPISFQIGASDNPGDTVKLTAYGLPIGATFVTNGVNPITGTFTWTPTASQEGDYVLNFVTEDTAGVQNSTTVNLSVSFKPRFNIPTTPGNNSVFTQVPGQIIQHPVVAYHPDALDLVTMNVYGAKPGMSFSPAFPLAAANPVGTIFQWTPAASDWGLNRVAFKAIDDFYGESAYDTIYYIIDNPPVITTTPVLYAYADSAYSYVLKAYDTDTPYGDKTKLEVATLPSFLTASNPNASNSWGISGTPTTANIGTYTINFEVADSLNHLFGTHAGNATQTYILKVFAKVAVSGTVTNATIFGANNGAIDITATGGEGPYTYSWSNNATTEDLSGIAAGTYTVIVTDAHGATATATFTVTQPAQLTVSGIATNATIYGTSNGGIDITVAGGVGPYTYSWSNNATIEDLSGIAAGTYAVTVTDANGATATGTYTVTQPAQLVVTGTVTNATIYGNSNGGVNITVAGGVGPYTYSWSNNSTNEDLSNIGAGTYTVTVTDANGATATGTYTVTQPAQLVVSGAVTNATIYGNSNGGVNITAAGGVGPYTYSWSNNSTIEDLSNIGAGTYTVTVTDANGATATGTYTVTQPAQLVVTGTVTNATIYGNSNGIVDITAAGGVGPYTYSWSNSATTEDLNGLAAGTYTVTVTDANGATATGVYTVTQPAQLLATAVVTNATIYGNSNGAIDITVTGGVGPYTYSWSNNATTQDLNGLAAGTYTVTVTDANGAVFTATYTITQPAQLAVAGVVTNATIYGNNNGAIDITVTGGVGPYTYSWSNNATTEDLSGLAAGTYTVIVTDANGATKTMTFTVTQPAQLAVSGVVTNVSSYGGSNGAINITVTGGFGPYSYTWSNGSHLEDQAGLTAGTYTVTVTDANGAVKTATYTVTQPSNMVVTLSVSPTYTVSGQAPYTIYDGYGPQSVVLSANVTGGVAPYTYNWTPSGSLSNATSANPAATPQVTTTYTLTVTDANGTVKTATQTIAVVDVNCGNGNNQKVSVCHRTLSCFCWWHIHTASCYSYNTICISVNAVATHLAHGDHLGECMDVYGVPTNVACHGGSTGAINLTVVGGVPPYSYSWSTGDTTQDISGIAAGTYTVTVTGADGRIVSESFTVNQPSALTANGVVSNTCYGTSNGSINQTVTGGTCPYTYAWSNSNVTTQDRSNLAAGTYAVNITDAKGCSVSKSYTVTQPSSAIAVSGVVTNVSCNGNNNGAINITVTGGAGSYTYNWSDNSNNTNNNNHNHNCHSWWSGWCGSHCNNYNGIGTTQDLTSIEAGTYNVTVTDANGCTKTASFTVTEPTAISAGISVSPSTPVNGGQPYTIYLGYGAQSVTLSAAATGGKAPYTYQWSGYGLNSTASSVTVSPTTTKTYTLTVTDANGCTKTVTRTINVVDVRCNSNGNNIKIEMCHNGHEICVDLASVATHLAQGDYIGDCDNNRGGGCWKQTGTDNTGATNDAATMAVMTGTADINVYPNPSTGNFTVELPADAQNAMVIITDISGKIIERKAANNERTVQFDMNNAAKGTYMINVINGNQSYKSKVSIQ